MLSFKLKPFLIGLLATILIVACQNNTVRQLTNSQLADCRTVQHLMGEVCVPKIPQRLVSLDNVTFADALSVEVPSVGVSTFDNHLPKYLTDKIGDVELLGNSENPSLEKIYQLNSDLIVGIKFSAEPIYSQLSQIAPTAVGEWNGYPSWREYFDFVASVLGKESEAKVVWDNYNSRIKELKNALGDSQDLEISLAYAYGNKITMDAENSFAGSILADLGIRRPKSQAVADGGIIPLSEERISDLDADILFVSIFDEESEQILTDWQQKPLWNQLQVVQSKQVYTQLMVASGVAVIPLQLI